MKTIIVFPGQGSQRVGMASDFYEHHAAARAVFEEASDALNYDVARLCFDDHERIHLTEFTQPAIVTAEIAMYRALQDQYGLTGEAFAGHSLGEYAALVAAGVISLRSAVRIVRERGRQMQQAVPEGIGAMAAIILPDLPVALLEECLEGLRADIANHNAPNQVVISGEAGDVQTATERFQDHEAGMRAKVRFLSVSAPFHSRLMQGIEPGFQAVLYDAATHWACERSTVVASNTTGGFHDGSTAGLVERLTCQISGTVRWVDNMTTLCNTNPSRILEIGPGRPLRGFFRGMAETLGSTPIESITNLASARRALETIVPLPSPVGEPRVAPRA
ncbi:MAG: ACP S-malonyltransferase [Myxococcota bacterium]|nr:ACP S-malonyltransferase [Myxococcota bacterium]MEC9389799.1 ACP S-malonyltransferase [Myxococcota bacterium]